MNNITKEERERRKRIKDALDRTDLPTFDDYRNMLKRPKNHKQLWAIQHRWTGLWWTKSRTWGKRPKIYNDIGQVEKAIRCHKWPKDEIFVRVAQIRKWDYLDLDGLNVDWEENLKSRLPEELHDDI